MSKPATGPSRRDRRPRGLPGRLSAVLGIALLLVAIAGTAQAQRPAMISCVGALPGEKEVSVPPQTVEQGGTGADSQPNLEITRGKCTISKNAAYYYGNVNIYSNGSLEFKETADQPIDFWAQSIIVENTGKLIAGSTTAPFGPLGTRTAKLTLHLYGLNQTPNLKPDTPTNQQGIGAICRTLTGTAGTLTTAPCGIPLLLWNDGYKQEQTLPGGVLDRFYKYDPMYGDGRADPTYKPSTPADEGGFGYFGYKVLGVSYGGTLELFGYKGATYDPTTDANPVQSGTSWMRLNDGNSLKPTDKTLVLEKDVGTTRQWQNGDQIVVTTTDYLPRHSEQLTITTPPTGDTVKFQRTICNPEDPPCPGLAWPHSGVRYGGPKAEPSEQRLSERLKPELAQPGRITADRAFVADGVETRAAVALLSRSIRIVSEGDFPGETFADATTKGVPDAKPPIPPDPHYAFGGHTVFRQGFAKLNIQGVEFYQMGQGGKLGHYPVHFHMARAVPQPQTLNDGTQRGGTFVKDSSIHDSMTRWIVIHSTLGVTLARNVGYLSIGHGFYLEDATETENKLYSNIGIMARAAVVNDQNSRAVPGILAHVGIHKDFSGRRVDKDFPYDSDYTNPSVFWITNGWNEFIGNMAAGAGTCGACYWLVDGWNSGITDDPRTMPPGMTSTPPMKWTGYSALQARQELAATTPLKTFYKNYCSSAMNSFMAVGQTTLCEGVVPATTPPSANKINAVASIAPEPKYPLESDTYYPHVQGYTGRKATRCPAAPTLPGQLPQYDCSAFTPLAPPKPKCDGTNVADCAVTVLDHYTSAFNWAAFNFAAVWLRPQWYLFDNSVISDVQGAGITMVTGGGYTRSDVILGYWGLMMNSLFIGATQPQDATGNPFARIAGPFNADSKAPCLYNGNNCTSKVEGVAVPLDNFGVSQRLLSVYDGPVFEDSNLFLDIKTSNCTDDKCIYFRTPGLRKNLTAKSCYMPNAAIGWKQPNGFYYPPNFHSDNLVFDNVDIRHFVISPLYKAGTYISDPTAITTNYCGNNQFSFTNFTDLDRQTELSDDDGTLTGLIARDPALPNTEPTTSVNGNLFFQAPVDTAECRSNVGVAADKACAAAPGYATEPSARTSPYQYLTFAVAPGCTQGNTCDATTNPFKLWNADCAGPHCYGVPLYRQYLTKLEQPLWIKTNTNLNPPCVANPTLPSCKPFIRMAGTGSFQRETMLANHGQYYVDTTLDASTNGQKNPNQGNFSSVNVFEAKSTYYFYFVYAQPTKQLTFQLYVGPGFQVSDKTIYPVHGNLNGLPLQFTPAQTDPHATMQKVGWSATPATTDASGILTININFKGTDFNGKSFAKELNVKEPENGLCQPASFCKWDNRTTPTACISSLAKTDRLYQDSTRVCGTWAIKDLDCPAAGCLGFAIKFPDNFKADNVNRRPTPVVFPTTPTSGWLTTFLNTKTVPDNGSKGSCFYPKVPGPGCPPAQ